MLCPPLHDAWRMRPLPRSLLDLDRAASAVVLDLHGVVRSDIRDQHPLRVQPFSPLRGRLAVQDQRPARLPWREAATGRCSYLAAHSSRHFLMAGRTGRCNEAFSLGPDSACQGAATNRATRSSCVAQPNGGRKADYQLLSRTWLSPSVFTTRGVAGSLPGNGPAPVCQDLAATLCIPASFLAPSSAALSPS